MFVGPETGLKAWFPFVVREQRNLLRARTAPFRNVVLQRVGVGATVAIVSGLGLGSGTADRLLADISDSKPS